MSRRPRERAGNRPVNRGMWFTKIAMWSKIRFFHPVIRAIVLKFIDEHLIAQAIEAFDESPDRFMPLLHLITFPHPILRYRSKPILRVDAHLKELVAEMFDIMYEHRGVGLAANQVNLPLRLFVANPSGAKATGPEYIFLNPVINRPTGSVQAEEGCLSLPGINAQVKRNKSLCINAYDLMGNEINMSVDGFLARIIQHETDHLDGVLFIDRLADENQKPILDQLGEFETIESKQRSGRMPESAILDSKRTEWERRYC